MNEKAFGGFMIFDFYLFLSLTLFQGIVIISVIVLSFNVDSEEEENVDKALEVVGDAEEEAKLSSSFLLTPRDRNPRIKLRTFCTWVFESYDDFEDQDLLDKLQLSPGGNMRGTEEPSKLEWSLL